jgi:hypothetical protein
MHREGDFNIKSVKNIANVAFLLYMYAPCQHAQIGAANDEDEAILSAFTSYLHNQSKVRMLLLI